MTDFIRRKAKAALLSAQRTTRTDMLYAAKGGFWLSAGTIITAAASFLLSLAYANLLPKEAYGTFKYVLAVGGMLAAFSLSGFPKSLTLSVARGYRGLLPWAWRTAFFWSTPMTALGLAASAYYFMRGNPTLGAGILVFALLHPVTAGSSVFLSHLQGVRDFRRSSMITSLQHVVAAAVMALASYLTDGPVILVAAYLGTHAIFLAAAYGLELRRNPPEPLRDPKVMPFAKHLTAMQALGTVADHLDRILIFQILGAAPTAAYSFARALPDQMRTVPNILTQLATPKYAVADPRSARSSMWRKVLIVTGLMTLIAGAYALLAPWIFRTLYPQYSEAVPYTQALALLAVFSAASSLPGSYLTARMAVRRKYLLSIITPLFRLALMASLIGPFGLWGIVWALVISKAVNTILLLVITLAIPPQEGSGPENQSALPPNSP